MLQLPEIYTGGYLYDFSKTGDIDGVPMPQERHSVNNYHDVHARKIQLKMLDSAPVGAVYTLKFHEEWNSHGELIQLTRKMTWIKASNGEWKQCNTD